MTATRPRCAVVIPTFNGLGLLRNCLAALLQSPPASCDWRIIVVDDASSDGTVGALADYPPPVELLALRENVGFARACNLGAAEAADCDYVVFLNNDTLPLAGWLDALVRVLREDPAVAIAGARLLYPNGSIQHAGIAISQDRWPRHLYTGFPGDHPAVTRDKRVAAVTGACMIVARDEFEAAGRFDAAFHNGYEDIDLCLRLRAARREIAYCPQSVLYHLESVTRWRDGPEPTDSNDRLYAERWLEVVQPDDVQHFLDDELLAIDYESYYPIAMKVSPLLASVTRDDEGEHTLERLLSVRSQQVLSLLGAATRRELREAPPPALTGAPRRAPAAPSVIATGRTHQIGRGTPRHLVSLLMPVKNEAASLRELIPLWTSQSYATLIELVAVDSGSSDDTIDVLREFGATVVAIDPADFDHGLTRNLAASYAKGDVLVFLNGRTRPVDEHWLGPLVAALDEDPAIAGACSRVVAHPDADPITQHDGELELSGAPVRERKEIRDWAAYEAMSAEQRRVFLNFHTVSAALRADVFSQIPFRSVQTIGEDLLWAREAVEAGWALIHEPASLAFHSHTYGLRELFSRNVDDGIANRDIVGRALAEADVRPLVEALIRRDWDVLSGDASLDPLERRRLEQEAAMRRLAQIAGQWVGANYRELPEGVVSAFSRIGQTRSVGRRSES